MSKGTILVVDTDPMHKNEWERIANGHGYDVLTAHGVSDALKILDTAPDAIDAVVSDLDLANGRTALELLREMRQPDTDSLKEPHKHPFILHTLHKVLPPEYKEWEHEISATFLDSGYYNIEGKLFNTVLEAMGKPDILKFTQASPHKDRIEQRQPTVKEPRTR